MQDQKEDAFYMYRAIELAKKGCGWTNPNPMVGAVIEKNGHIIGEGYHEKYGTLHAERSALAHCSENPSGATIYVTLEPCCHYGKQPPCTDAIIESGIKRVVAGSLDPNPLVAGKGIEILRKHGVQVETGLLKAECDAINEVFFHYMQTGRPLVVMKYAMTLDGKIATYTGNSQWITGEEARKHVHEQRNRYMAIMTGIGTVLADDPLLTCRIEGGRNPIRIICDTRLRIPLDSHIVKTAGTVPTIIATAAGETQVSNIEKNQKEVKKYENAAIQGKIKALRSAGCKLLYPGIKEGHLDLKNLIGMLGKGTAETNNEKIDSIYLEGGQTLNWSALDFGIVDKINAYIAPKLFGGVNAFSPVGGIGVREPDEGVRLTNIRLLQLGEDYMMEGDLCLQELSKRQEKRQSYINLAEDVRLL